MPEMPKLSLKSLPESIHAPEDDSIDEKSLDAGDVLSNPGEVNSEAFQDFEEEENHLIMLEAHCQANTKQKGLLPDFHSL